MLEEPSGVRREANNLYFLRSVYAVVPDVLAPRSFLLRAQMLLRGVYREEDRQRSDHINLSTMSATNRRVI